jgi:hypothetical protein
MNSLPVAFGVDGAKYICAATIDVTQLSVAAYLFAGLHEPIYAAVLLGLTLPQVSKGTGGHSHCGGKWGTHCLTTASMTQACCPAISAQSPIYSRLLPAGPYQE